MRDIKKIRAKTARNAKNPINKTLRNFAVFARHKKSFRAKLAMIAKELIIKTLRNFAIFARHKKNRGKAAKIAKSINN